MMQSKLNILNNYNVFIAINDLLQYRQENYSTQ